MKWDRGVRCQFRFELVILSASKPIRLLQTLTFILYREGGRVSSISFGHATYDLQRGQVQHKPRLARGRAAGRDSARFCFPGVQIQSAAHFARSLPWAEVAVVWCQFGRAVESVAVLGGGRDPGDTLAPFSVGYIKGWRRSVACLAVAEAIKALDILDEVSAQYKACWRPSGGVCVCVFVTFLKVFLLSQRSLSLFRQQTFLYYVSGVHVHSVHNCGAIRPCPRPSAGVPRPTKHQFQ